MFKISLRNDKGDDSVSAAWRHASKRKRQISPGSDASTSDLGPRRSVPNGSDTSRRNRAIKSFRENDGRASITIAKQRASLKGKERAIASGGSSSESDEETVAASLRKSTGFLPFPSPYAKSIEAGNSRVGTKRRAKPGRISTVAKESEAEEVKGEESEGSTNLFRSTLTSSPNASSTYSRPIPSKGGDRTSITPRKAYERKDTSLESSKVALLDESYLASSKAPSPAKGSNDHSATDAQALSTIRKLQSQNATLKQRWDESEDRFNEASARCETLSAQLSQLEDQLKRSKKTHEENLRRVEENMKGSGYVQRLASAQIDDFKHELVIERNHHHEAMMDLQRQLDRSQRELQAAQGGLADSRPMWAQRHEGRDAERVVELEQELRTQREEYESKIMQLERDVALPMHSAQLAAKERELEAIRMSYTQELDSREEKYNRLKALHDMDKQAWAFPHQMTTPQPGRAPSEDILQLQKQVSVLTKQKSNYELHFQATVDTYEARIKRIQKEAAARIAEDREQIASLESSRRTLDFDRARFQGQVATLTSTRTTLEDKLADKLARLRSLQSAYDELKVGCPKLSQEYKMLQKSHNLHKRENDNLRSERREYTEKVQALESQIDEYIALLQSANAKSTSGKELSDEYKLLESTYSIERQAYKRRIKKLEQRIAQYGLGSDDVSDRDSAPVQSTSDGEQVRRLSDDAQLAESAFASATPTLETPPAVPDTRSKASIVLQEQLKIARATHAQQFSSYEKGKPAYQFPPTLRERKAYTKVPRHKSRVYVRSECHTPYVPDEMVSDSDDEFLEWESEAYAKSQASNPDRKAAVVNTCWNRHILDFRCNRVRSTNLHFCIAFVESYGPLINSRDATPALVKHILKLVDLGQLTVSEGGTVVRAYHRAV